IENRVSLTGTRCIAKRVYLHSTWIHRGINTIIRGVCSTLTNLIILMSIQLFVEVVISLKKTGAKLR
ncbi:hypothetical protein ALC62_01758, partial [Cyphomyrmex costatus]